MGGPKFLKSVGDDLIDSVLTSNYGINLEQEKYNEALTSSVKRVAAVLEGQRDPVLRRRRGSQGEYFKTRAETNEKRDVFANVVIGLLVISFVVPMLQYAGYAIGDPDFDEEGETPRPTRAASIIASIQSIDSSNQNVSRPLY